MSEPSHRWLFQRSGGVDQVVLRSREDLLHLDQLDPKLWIALSMPTRGVELDPRTLDVLDTDKDGHVRHPEVLAAITWARGVYKDVGHVLDGGDSVALDRLKDGPVLAGARRLLNNLGKQGAGTVSLADATSAEKMFADTLFNGDGVIPAEAASGELRGVIEDIIATHGSLLDRSGKPGVDKPRIDAFFSEARALVAWYDQASPQVLPVGEATHAAADAVRAVRTKIDDYFTRCRLAAFDPRAATALNAGDGELAALASQQLSADSAEVASLPLARVDAAGVLPLTAVVNPAWQARVDDLVAAAVTPLLGPRDRLDARDWRALLDKLAAHEAWRVTKPASAVDKLGLDRLRALIAPDHEAGVGKLLAEDLALAPEVDSVTEVEKLCRFQRDLGKLLNNYVNFSLFYARKGGVFQAGTLYLDARGCTLVLEVTDATKHASMAPMAGAYIAYCDCVRPGGDKKHIAAAFTAGSIDNLMVGRNGVFIDRQGLDWEATITKIIENPISVRQAFWAPYKKLVRMIDQRVAKKAAAADAEAQSKLEKTAAPGAPAAAAAPEAANKGMDIGTVAAIGVAVGGIGALATAILAAVFGLGKWMPIGIVVLLLMISGPSMLLAFIKLRRRNLGPLLDANGWAINALTRINVPFGTALTDRRMLPEGAQRSLDDPYADKRTHWRLWLTLLALVALGTAWFVGKLDRYLPEAIRSTTVLGVRAPAPSPAPAPAPAAAPAPAPAAAPAATDPTKS